MTGVQTCALPIFKDHFVPQGQVDGCRKSFLLYGMGGIGKPQICLKFVEEMAGR